MMYIWLTAENVAITTFLIITVERKLRLFIIAFLIILDNGLLLPPYGIGQAIISSSCGFFFLSSFFFFPRLFSAVADWMSTMLPLMVWP